METPPNNTSHDAAERLMFDAQFAELRAVLEAIPGIDGTLPQLPEMSEQLDGGGEWILAFDVEPSELGFTALENLTATLMWCEEHHDDLRLPAFDHVVFFAAGFVLRVWAKTPSKSGELAVPPDALAHAIKEHFDHCSSENDSEQQRWSRLQDEAQEHYLQSAPNGFRIDPESVAFDMPDPREQVLVLLVDGKPMARYRFEESGDAFSWHRCDGLGRGGKSS